MFYFSSLFIYRLHHKHFQDEDPTEKNIKAVRYALDTFAEQLFKDVENRKTRAFCSCVKKIMNAYELKSQKVKSLRKIIKQLRANEQQYQKEIKQLRNQLASSLCKRCEEEIATEQMRVLSMREHNSEVLILLHLLAAFIPLIYSNKKI